MPDTDINISHNLLLCILYAMTSDMIARCEGAFHLPDLQPEERDILASLTLSFTDEVKNIANELVCGDTPTGQSLDTVIYNLITGKQVE